MSSLLTYGSSRARLTAEGGLAVLMTNGTGATSVKGSLVAASTAADRAFVLQANEYDAIGAVYESGVANGSDCWVVVSGVAEVLFKDTVGSTRGNILIADAVDGRGSDIANPGSGLPAVETHFKECGHVLETKAGGTGVLVLCALHFN